MFGPAVFAVKPWVLREFEARAADDPEPPDGVEEPWVSLEFNLVLAPGGTAGEIVDPGRTH